MNKMDLSALPASAKVANTSELLRSFGPGLPPPVVVEVADTGRIRFGAGVRLPALRLGA